MSNKRLQRLTLADARVLIGEHKRPRAAYHTQPPQSQADVQVQVAIGSHSSEAIRAAAVVQKRTGEWKVPATGGRRSQFNDGTLQLMKYDHNVGPQGERLGRRKQESNFFVTVSTNQRKWTGKDQKAVQDAVSLCFGDRAYDILEFGPYHSEYKADAEHPQAIVENIKTRATVEMGPVTGALHAHVWFRVAHWSQLRIDKRALQVMFKKAYNERADTPIKTGLPAVQLKLMPQSDLGQIMAHYLTKQVASEQAVTFQTQSAQ